MGGLSSRTIKLTSPSINPPQPSADLLGLPSTSPCYIRPWKVSSHATPDPVGKLEKRRFRPVGDRRRRHRLRHRTRRGHPRPQGRPGGARRLRLRHLQSQHQADPRRGSLPRAGSQEIGQGAMEPGARRASRTRDGDQTGPAPGAPSAAGNAPLQLVRHPLLPDRPQDLRLAGGKVQPQAQPLPERQGGATQFPDAKGKGAARRGALF